MTSTPPPAYTPIAAMASKKVPVGGQNTRDAVKPVNILILGETQNGKSTLIKQLGVYSKKRDNDIGIGNGRKHNIHSNSCR
jgi:hypothetical protein